MCTPQSPVSTRRTVLISALFWVLCLSSTARSQWRSVGGENYTGAVVHGGHYYVCDTHGTLLRSENGATWERLQAPFPRMWSMTSSWDHLLIGGLYGTIARSSNSGISWQVSHLGTAGHVMQLTTVPNTSIIIAGCWNGDIFRSTDEGASWVAAEVENRSDTNCRGIAFASSAIGYFSTETGGLYRTSDSGAHWVPIGSPSHYAWGTPYAVGDSTLWVGTGSVLYKTSNLGRTWDTLYRGFAPALLSHNGNTVFAFGTGAVWATSSDSGMNWALHLDSNFWIPQSIQAIAWKDSLNAIRVGIPGLIFATVDGGSTWKPRTLAPMHDRSIYKSSLMVAHAIDSAGVLAAGEAAMVCRSTDHGTTWLGQTVHPERTVRPDFYRLLQIGRDTLLTAGDFGSTYRSSDGGTTWSYIQEAFTDGVLRDLVRLSTGEVFISDGTVYRSSDAGVTWALWSRPDAEVRNMTVGAGDTVLATLVSGVSPATIIEISRSTDHCLTWARTASPILPTTQLLLRYFEGKGWYALADSGTIYRSTNAGDSWSRSSTGYGSYTRDMLWITDSLGFVAVYPPAILRTTDAGASWTRDSLPPPVLSPGFAANSYVVNSLTRVGSFVIAAGFDNIYQLALQGDAPLGVTWRPGPHSTVAVWPNPTTMQLRWESEGNGPMSVRVFNASGKSVRAEILKEPRLDISNLVPGAYWMLIEQHGCSYVAQFVVKR